jgi:hypothetical protein
VKRLPRKNSRWVPRNRVGQTSRLPNWGCYPRLDSRWDFLFPQMSKLQRQARRPPYIEVSGMSLLCPPTFGTKSA